MDIIICWDFMGVMDCKDSYENNNPSLSFRLREIIDESKAIMLMDFALKNNAKLCSISSFAQWVNMDMTLYNAIALSEDPKAKAIMDKLESLGGKRHFKFNMVCRSLTKGKRQIVEDITTRHPESLVISFDDEYVFDECESIFVNGYERLRQSDLDKAQSLISEKSAFTG